jgi:hypothetical protein
MSMRTHSAYSRASILSFPRTRGVYSKKNGIRSPSMAAHLSREVRKAKNGTEQQRRNHLARVGPPSLAAHF